MIEYRDTPEGLTEQDLVGFFETGCGGNRNGFLAGTKVNRA